MAVYSEMTTHSEYDLMGIRKTCAVLLPATHGQTISAKLHACHDVNVAVFLVTPEEHRLFEQARQAKTDDVPMFCTGMTMLSLRKRSHEWVVQNDDNWRILYFEGPYEVRANVTAAFRFHK